VATLAPRDEPLDVHALADLDVALEARDPLERPLERRTAAAEQDELAVALLALAEVEPRRQIDGERQLERAVRAQQVQHLGEALAHDAREAREEGVRVPELRDPGAV